MGETTNKLLVVTDLDGTLLNGQYRWDAAQESVTRLRESGYPLVLNSSKTLAELVDLAGEMNTDAPLIAENGGIIAVPGNASIATDDNEGAADQFGYHISFVGKRRDEILKVAHDLREEAGFDFEGFSDWSADQVIAKTGLSALQAKASMNRLATEPILWNDSEERWDEFISLIGDQNIRALKGGRFVHLMGQADKASAMLELKARYVKAYPHVDWKLVALGDSPNDLAMLSSADIAVVIPDAAGQRLSPDCGCVVVASQPGPKGWHEAMTKILNDNS